MRCYFNLVSSHHTVTDDEGLEVGDADSGVYQAIRLILAGITPTECAKYFASAGCDPM
jgi:hypothetical protein